MPVVQSSFKSVSAVPLFLHTYMFVSIVSMPVIERLFTAKQSLHRHTGMT